MLNEVNKAKVVEINLGSIKLWDLKQFFSVLFIVHAHMQVTWCIVLLLVSQLQLTDGCNMQTYTAI